MAKTKKKKAKAKKPLLPAYPSPLEPRAARPGEGDLRRVATLLEAYRAGDEAAMSQVQQMGRDAAFVALAYAESVEDEELRLWARRLVAMPPEVKTNLQALRESSVDAVIAAARRAPSIFELGLPARRSLALFDPSMIKPALVRGGKPRENPEALQKGWMARFGFEASRTIRLLEGQAPTDGLEARLRCGSGVVAVGEASAADGPKMGSVRLDPFHTGLDQAIEDGRVSLGRMPLGVFRITAVEDGNEVALYLRPDPAPHQRLLGVAAKPKAIPSEGPIPPEFALGGVSPS